MPTAKVTATTPASTDTAHSSGHGMVHYRPIAASTPATGHQQYPDAVSLKQSICNTQHLPPGSARRPAADATGATAAGQASAASWGLPGANWNEAPPRQELVFATAQLVVPRCSCLPHPQFPARRVPRPDDQGWSARRQATQRSVFHSHSNALFREVTVTPVVVSRVRECARRVLACDGRIVPTKLAPLLLA
jgi:hypothetical protein